MNRFTVSILALLATFASNPIIATAASVSTNAQNPPSTKIAGWFDIEIPCTNWGNIIKIGECIGTGATIIDGYGRYASHRVDLDEQEMQAAFDYVDRRQGVDYVCQNKQAPAENYEYAGPLYVGGNSGGCLYRVR
jgi:hypothetical protein